jgi:hypothetical protein
MNSFNIKIEQHGSFNQQNNTFNFSATRQREPIPSNVRQGSKNFVGREAELEQIHGLLRQGRGAISPCEVC